MHDALNACINSEQLTSHGILKRMRTFHAVILGIFVLLALGSIVILATFTNNGGNKIGDVEIWGPLPNYVMDDLFRELRGVRSDFEDVKYRTVAKQDLVPQLVEAIASGRAPDLVLFPSSYVVREAEKLVTVPYSSLSKRQFQDTFVQAGEVFLFPEGIKGIPFTIDPLVMYWNRQIFAAVGIAQPPRYWDELTELAPRLTKKDERGTLETSAVALGSWDNVSNAKELFLTLLHGLGNPVVKRGEDGYQSTLKKEDATGDSADSALRFVAQFADPVKPVYSWNRSQKNSRDAFLNGTLAMYYGPASELLSIRAANPNLNFDVAELPRIRSGVPGGYADLYAFVIPNGSRNQRGALLASMALTDPGVQKALSRATGLPSVRRDATALDASNAYETTFREASVSAFAFLDPDPSATDGILKRMLENVLSGKLRTQDATIAGNAELQALIGVK